MAEQEGFRDVAAAFRYIAKVEVEHEKRYRKLLENVEAGTVFKKGRKEDLDLQELRLPS